ncbi:MAG TPA: methyltransferase domain-containing protein [Terracidiphilus sp.]|jgi:SAM-dependent methyltransferase|nr:methyltransferase domain-containing protein [Terracidiphilus sp.]
MIQARLKQIAKVVLPASVRHWMRQTAVRVGERPPYGLVNFGSLRRTTPVHAGFGMGRGTYIDRYYIERFLEQNAECIQGRVLELANNEYTLRFGGKRVTQSDVLDVRAGHAPATIIADLAAADNVPSDAFDCIILTQTLNFIYDVRAVIETTRRLLKPGGCVLVSVASISQIAPDEMKYCGDYWRFTSLSLRRLFEEAFPPENVAVEAHGNVLAALAFLHGLAVEELCAEELDYRDPGFELTVLLKAVKPR